MKFNTAGGLTLAGAALWWRQRPALRLGLATLVTLFGALTLGEYVSGHDWGIDQFLFREVPTPPMAAYTLGRMAPSTALCFLLCGVALMYGRGTIAQAFAVGVVAVAGFALVGYATGVEYLHHLPGYISMALNTTAAFVLLAAGIVCATPEGMVSTAMRSRGAGRVLWLGFGLLTVLLVALGTVAAARLQSIAVEVDALTKLARHPDAIAAFDARTGDTLRELQTAEAWGLVVLVAGVVVALVTSGTVARAVLGHEQSLRESAVESARQKELLAVTLASIGDAVIVTDKEGRVTFLNGEAGRLTGWRPDEAEGRPLLEVFNIMNEQTRQPVESPVDNVLRLGSVVGLANHTTLIARDGRETPIDDSGAAVRQADGTVHGVVLVFRDITERKQIEERIGRQVEELRAGNAELTRLSQAMVGRELRMVELKKEVNQLCGQARQSPRYAVDQQEVPP